MKSAKYRIEFRRQTASYYLGVFSRSDDWGGAPDWMVEVPTDEPLILWEFIDDTRLVVSDWYAQIWIFDVEKQELAFHHAFSENLSGKTVLSEDLKELHVIYKGDKRNYNHAVVDLSKIEIIRDTEYPEISYVKNCERYKDKLFLYEAERKDAWSHVYDIIDMKTGEYKKQSFEHPQYNDSDKRKPFIDEKNGKLIMPYYSEIEHREDPERGIILRQQIAIFDINTFELENVFPVRDFPVREIDPDEEDGKKNVERIIKGPEVEGEEKEDYEDAVHDFHKNLRSILFDEDGETFWICWGAGAMRRMDYKGNMSRMYVRVAEVEEGEFSPPFEYNYNHIVLYRIYEDRFVFLDHSSFIQILREDLEGRDELTAKIDDIHLIEMNDIDDEELPILDMPSTFIYKWESMVRFNMF